LRRVLSTEGKKREENKIWENYRHIKDKCQIRNCSYAEASKALVLRKDIRIG
jgi:hypothetical protein